MYQIDSSVFQEALRGVEVANIMMAGHAHAERHDLPTGRFEQPPLGIIGNLAAYAVAQEGLVERMKVPHPDEALLQGSAYQALAHHERGEAITDLAIRARGIYDAMRDVQRSASATQTAATQTEFHRNRPTSTTEHLRDLDRLGNRDLIRLLQGGDTDAGATLLAHHHGGMGMVVNDLVRKVGSEWPAVSRDDLIQEARAALLKTALSVDADQPDLDFVKVSYSAARTAVDRYFTRNRSTIRVPAGGRQRIRRMENTVPLISQEPASDMALSRELNLPMGESGQPEHERVNTIKSIRRHKELQNPWRIEDSGPKRDMPRIERMHSLTSDELPHPDEEVIGKVSEEAVRAILRELPDREREILVLRFWGNMSLDAIGEHLGSTGRRRITGSRVQAILAKTLAKLRHPQFSDRLPKP